MGWAFSRFQGLLIPGTTCLSVPLNKSYGSDQPSDEQCPQELGPLRLTTVGRVGEIKERTLHDTKLVREWSSSADADPQDTLQGRTFARRGE